MEKLVDLVVMLVTMTLSGFFASLLVANPGAPDYTRGGEAFVVVVMAIASVATCVKIARDHVIEKIKEDLNDRDSL